LTRQPSGYKWGKGWGLLLWWRLLLLLLLLKAAAAADDDVADDDVEVFVGFASSE
jgi:hypothetical protein